MIFKTLLSNEGAGNVPSMLSTYNTIGGSVAFNPYGIAGEYYLTGFTPGLVTLDNFSNGKIVFRWSGNPTISTHNLTASVESDDVVKIRNFFGVTGNDDDGLTRTEFQIEVLP